MIISSFWIGQLPNPDDGTSIKKKEEDLTKDTDTSREEDHMSRGGDGHWNEAARSQYANSCQQPQEARDGSA